MPTKKATIRAVIVPNHKGKEASVPNTPMVGAGSLIARQRDSVTGKFELVECITVRTFYSSNGSGMQPVRACVWIQAPRGSNLEWLSGRGFASGCGYHKESAAIDGAVTNAGIVLYGDPYRREPADMKKRCYFGGTGSSAYREIFEAIAKARGFRGPYLWASHGL